MIFMDGDEDCNWMREVGLAIGVGRLGAIAAPSAGGLMLETGLEISLI